MQYNGTRDVETYTSTEMLPPHGEKNINENHQAQNKNILLYHKTLKMLRYGQKAPSNSLLTDSSVYSGAHYHMFANFLQ